MNTFDHMYYRVTSGAIGNWLAILGLLSLMYWTWRIIAAVQRRKIETPPAVAHAIAPERPHAEPPSPPSVPHNDDIAAIAAAVQVMIGERRLVHIVPDRGESHWESEGRWMQQTSHQPR
jgi:hypothetical protein